MNDEDPPESDPYCAHLLSVCEDHDITCEKCGHSCKDHPALWGLWCLHGCNCQFENEKDPCRE